jgi:cellulose synthase operon protein C
MKRINTRLLFTLLAIVVFGGAGMYVIHGIQAKRSSKGNLLRAEDHHKNGDLENAIKSLSRYVRYQREDLKEMGRLALWMKEKFDKEVKNNAMTRETFQDAHATIEEALRRDPENIEVRDAAIDLALNVRRYNDAIEHLKAKLSRKKSVKDEVRLIQAYRDSEQRDKAMELITKLLGWDPVKLDFAPLAEGTQDAQADEDDKVDAYMVLVGLLQQKKEIDVAKQVIDRMVERHPNSPKAHLQRAVYLSISKPDEKEPVQEELRKALELAPDDVEVLLAAGRMAVINKDEIRANALFQRCLELHPDRIDVYFGLYNVALLKQDFEKAIEYLDSGLKKFPDAPAFVFYKGNLEIQLGKLEDTEKTIKQLQAMRNVPSQFPDFLRARLMIDRQEWLPAAQLLEAVRPLLQSFDPQILVSLDASHAMCYEKLGQHDLRLKSIERIVSRDPGNIAAIWAKIQCLLAMRQEEKAVAEYNNLDRLAESKDETKKSLIVERLQLEMIKQKLLPEAERSWKRLDELYELAVKLDVTEEARMGLTADILRLKGQEAEADELSARLESGMENRLPMRLNAIKKRAMSESYDKLVPDLDALQTEIGDNLVIRLLRADVIVRSRPENATELLVDLEKNVEDFGDAQKVDLWMGLGRCHAMLQSQENTKRLWTLVMQARPSDVNLRLTLFELALGEGNPEEVARQREEIDKLVGRDSPEGRWAEATSIYHAAISKDGDRSTLKKAAAITDEAIAQRPTWGQLYALRGDLQLLEGRNDLAIESFELAKENGSQNAILDRSLARLYYGAQRFADAKKALEQLPKPLWTDFEQRINLQLLALENKLPAKIDLNEEQTDAAGFVWLGNLLAGAQRHEEADDAFQKAIKKESGNVLAWAGRFSIKVATGDRDGANAIVDEAVKLIDQRAVASFLATTNRMLGNYERAEENYRKVIEANPDNPAAKQELIRFFVEINQFEKARPLLEEVIAVDPQGKPELENQVRWARRQLARVITSSALYADFLKARKLIEANAIDGKLLDEDILLWVQLSSNRPERVSRQEAVAKLLEAKKTKQLSDDAEFALAQLYHGLDDWNACESSMLSILANQPKNTQYLERWITWLLQRGDLDTASRWIDNLPPGSVAAIRVSTQQAVRRGRSTDAANVLKELLKNPRDANDEKQRLMVVAQVAEELGAIEARMFPYADAAWSRLVKKYPEKSLDFSAYLIRRKDPAKITEIMAACKTAFDAGNRIGAIQQGLAGLRMSRAAGDKWKAAADELQKWMAERDGSDRALLLLQDSEFAEISANFDQQEQFLRTYLTEFPKQDQRRAIVLNNLAYLLAIRGNSEEASPLIDEVLEILGPLGSVRDTKGMVELARNQPQAALKEFESSIEDDGPTAMKYYHLARAHMQLGNQKEAEEALGKSKELGLTTVDLGPLEIDTYKQFVKEMQAAGMAVQDITQASVDKQR